MRPSPLALRRTTGGFRVAHKCITHLSHLRRHRPERFTLGGTFHDFNRGVDRQRMVLTVASEAHMYNSKIRV